MPLRPHPLAAIVLLALALPLPATLAQAQPHAPGRVPEGEPYAGTSAGLASSAAACLGGVNAGAVCFELQGWERSASVHVGDAASALPVQQAIFLDAHLREMARADTCGGQPVSVPSGAAYLAVHFPATDLFRPTTPCRTPATAGFVTADFG